MSDVRDVAEVTIAPPEQAAFAPAPTKKGIAIPAKPPNTRRAVTLMAHAQALSPRREPSPVSVNTHNTHNTPHLSPATSTALLAQPPAHSATTKPPPKYPQIMLPSPAPPRARNIRKTRTHHHLRPSRFPSRRPCVAAVTRLQLHRRMSAGDASLAALPRPVLTAVLRRLCRHDPADRALRAAAPFWLPFRDPRVALSLRDAHVQSVPLPPALLAPALASPALAAAALPLLRDRATFLTYRNTAGQLPMWVEAFARVVRGVSDYDPACAWCMGRVPPAVDSSWFPVLDTHQRHSLRLFRALSLHAVMLEVLDLQDVVFLDFNGMGDHIMAGLCATLESSSATLRELALPVFPNSDICDKALAMSQLTKLDVLTFKSWPFYLVNDSKPLPPPVVRIIRAVNGHADRSRNLTTLRELRLLRIDSLGYRYLTAADRNSSVVLSIKTLRIFWRTNAFLWDGSHLVLSLFKNLERLFWNFTPGSADFFFEKLCTKIPEVHLSGVSWTETPANANPTDYSQPICDFFAERSYDCDYGSGAIASIYAGPMPPTHLRNMMNYCPRLQNISVNVTPDNIRPIRKLVAKCQQLKCLELLLVEASGGRSRIQDWHLVSQVVPKSHNALCQVAIQSPNGLSWPMAKIDPVFACFESVAKALGARAKSLTFRVGFRTERGAKIMERVCDLLNVCLHHTPALESLDISPRITKLDSCDYSRGHANELVRRLISMDSRLVRELQSLRTLSIGVSPWLLPLVNQSDGAVETETFSEPERTSPSIQTA